MPPEASRLVANVVRMLCSASGPSGSSSACGRAPSSPGTHPSGPAAPRIRPRSAPHRPADRAAAEAVPRDSGYSFTPVSAVRRCAMSSVRRSAHLGDLGGDVVAGVVETATGLDVLEVLPRLPRRTVGEVLDEPGAACRVEHATDVRFLQQQQLGVAGDAARETRCGAREPVRRWRRRTGAPGRCRRRRRPPRRRRAWCAACSPTDRAWPSSAATSPRAPSPHRPPASPTTSATRAHSLARRPQLRDGHELVVVGGQPETDLPQGIRDLDAAVAQQPQIGDRGGDTGRQFPRCARTQIVKCGAVNGDRPNAAVEKPLSFEARSTTRSRSGANAAAQRRGQRIGAEVHRQP